jgi:HAD superfamily hydrolase (TIGR01490 family)
METVMALALFDLDNTLLDGDSDHAWGLFLGKLGVVDAQEQSRMQDYFYAQYQDGSLDMQEFLQYQLKPLSDHPLDQLHRWRAQYVETIVEPMIRQGKADILKPHRDANDTIIIITATNDFITRPIADKLGVETLLATKAEFKNGRYTGRPEGTPCFQEGKITLLQEWLEDHPHDMHDSTFYSDSINDLPLLEFVDTPVAVKPDQRLRQHAEKLHWTIID